MEVATSINVLPETEDDVALWPESDMPIEQLDRLQTPQVIPETEDFPWTQEVSSSNNRPPPGMPDPTLPQIPVPIPPETPLNSKRELSSIDKRKLIKIPPAEQEITRMRRESYVMFMKRKREQNVQPPPTRNALRDFPLIEVPLFVPPERMEEEVVISGDSAAVEEWVNAHLIKGHTQLIPISDAYLAAGGKKTQTSMYQSKLEYSDSSQVNVISPAEKTPLQGAGIDSTSLLQLGMPKALVERIYRGLFVYSSGFHTLIHDIGRHCPAYAECHIASNVWLAFLHLLEKCEDGRYEMAMLKFNHATSIWKKSKMKEYEKEKEALLQELTKTQDDVKTEKENVATALGKLADQAEAMKQLDEKMRTTQDKFDEFEDEIRLLKMEIMKLEDDLVKKTDEHVQTSHALSLALTQKSDIESEISNFKAQIAAATKKLDKHEENKNRSSGRIRELQSNSQALREQAEVMRNEIRLLTMDKTKISNERTTFAEKSAALEKELASLKTQLANLNNTSKSQRRDIEERDATILSLTEAMEKDRNQFVSQQAEIARLTTLVNRQKMDYEVLEAQNQLLLIEKNNISQKEADKARIERLLNKKVELKQEIALLRQEKEQGQEQIWNLRASMEALENDLHHSKRAYAGSQTSLAQAERICEHLRGQMQEMERANEKLTQNLAIQKQQSKLLDDASREQVEKMEIELRVVMGQMREMVYTRRENEAQISDLTKSLEASAVEIRLNKLRIEKGDKDLAAMTFERDTLLRDKRIAQLDQSTNKAMIQHLNHATAQLMEKIRLHEINYEEAMLELKVHCDNATKVSTSLSSTASGIDLHSPQQPSRQSSSSSPQSSTSNLPPSVSGLLNLLVLQGAMENGGNGGHSGTLGALDIRMNRRPRRRSFKGGAIPSQNEYTIVELTAKLKKRDETIRRMDATIEEGRLALHQKQLAILREKERCAEWKENVAMARADHDTYKWIATTRYTALSLKCAEVESSLRDYKGKVKTLRGCLRNYKTLLDHMGMHAEDSRGTLMILYRKFITRRDQEVQATEPISDNSTQTYPPRRSPIKERAKLKQSMFSTESTAFGVLTTITDLLPDEELDHHFYSITHHGEQHTREYKLGHLLESKREARFKPLPQLARDSERQAKVPEARILAEYRNEFGHIERIAEPAIAPFHFDRPRTKDDKFRVSAKLAKELEARERLVHEINDGDYGKTSVGRPPARPSPRPTGHSKRTAGHRKVLDRPAESPSSPQQQKARRNPLARKKPRKIQDQGIIAQNEMEAEVLRLEELKAIEHATQYTPSVGAPPDYKSDENDEDDDEAQLDAYFVEEDGVLKRRELGGGRFPSLLEQKVKEMHEMEKLRESTSPTKRLVGWELSGKQVQSDRGETSESTTLPPILYPLTKS
ncbi:unnamed protein product [Aphanomyces euteiches]